MEMRKGIIMTDLEIIAAMEAELKALNTEVDTLEDDVNALNIELKSMEKEFK